MVSNNSNNNNNRIPQRIQIGYSFRIKMIYNFSDQPSLSDIPFNVNNISTKNIVLITVFLLVKSDFLRSMVVGSRTQKYEKIFFFVINKMS